MKTRTEKIAKYLPLLLVLIQASSVLGSSLNTKDSLLRRVCSLWERDL